jgi:SAM-dependent methyltransferase
MGTHNQPNSGCSPAGRALRGGAGPAPLVWPDRHDPASQHHRHGPTSRTARHPLVRPRGVFAGRGGQLPASVAEVSANPYEDPESARLYDAENSGREDVEHYLRLARELRDERGDRTGGGDRVERGGERREPFTVLDIGCGTGNLGVELAAEGHRVIGVDPAEAMLDIARTRPGGERVTWIRGSADAAPEGAADLAVMTGHAAQQIVPVDTWRALLASAHRALRPGGALAFESRDPRQRAWERWTPESTRGTFPHPDGGEFTSWVELLAVDESGADGSGDGGIVETHRGVTEREGTTRCSAEETLIFRPLEVLRRDLEAAGFTVERVQGAWSGGPVTEDSAELILLGRR